MQAPQLHSIISFCLTLLLSVSLLNSARGQNQLSSAAPSSYSYIQNKGQWHENILYKSNLAGNFNAVFAEANSLNYQIYDQTEIADLHDFLHEEKEILLKGHSYRVLFENGQSKQVLPRHIRKGFNNYFLGNDPKKHAVDVLVAAELVYEDLYTGIDLKLYRDEAYFKYEFILKPGANPAEIIQNYQGADALVINEGRLEIKTSVGSVFELPPYAYQVIEGEERQVTCNYQLQGTRLSYVFPEGYDASLPLVIDPTVVAATLTGHSINSNAGTFGHCATYDNQGNIYTAGLAFGIGYVTTIGAFQTNFAGEEDMAITKFTPDGTEMIYSTYLGGNESDYPNAMVTDFQQNLYVTGSTGSTDFPVAENALQSESGGLSDVFLTALNKEGNALIGSTYLGGSNSDGFNVFPVDNCYGDQHRSSVQIDQKGDILVGGATRSSDFPVTNAYDLEYNDMTNVSFPQDGFVTKLSPDLSRIVWSTFIGDENPDMINDLKITKNNQILIAGLAGSENFPTTENAYMSDFPGGQSSAFVAQLSEDGTDLLYSTFWGTEESDRAYFSDTDKTGNVYIYGVSTGNLPIIGDVYSMPEGSSTFITCFNPDLSGVLFSTLIGGGTEDEGFDFQCEFADVLPTAFGLDVCGNIHFSSTAAQNGLPISEDAFYDTGDSFYFGTLSPDAEELLFSSYYGRSNHNDGGTSDVSKEGVLYQAVCSCSNNGNYALETLDGAFAEEMPFGQGTCDLGVFKVDLKEENEAARVIADGGALSPGTELPSYQGVPPFTLDFVYTGQNATDFSWEFSTGETFTDSTFSYTFTDFEEYTVQLIAVNDTTCNMADTLNIIICGREEPSSTSNLEANKTFEVYPNPNKGTFTLALNVAPSRDTKLEISDALGRIVHTQTVRNQYTTIRENLAPGIYFLTLRGKEGASDRRQKIMIE